jgi:beta-lactamase class A
MAFYSPDPAMGQILADLVQAMELDGRQGLSQSLSVTWVRYENSLLDCSSSTELTSGLGASWSGDRLRYPASVVKLVYLIAVEAWLQQGVLEDSAELRRALAAMIQHSSNDATSLVVDLLSGTTSGPDLPAEAMAHWVSQRQLVNGWLTQLDWPELQGVNACQKTWAEGPFGRERLFYGAALENRNRLSTDATARLLEAVMASTLLSPPACRRMQGLLQRSLDPALRSGDPENQVDGFLGEGLPDHSLLWSKAGWMSQARHDAMYVEIPGQPPVLLVAFSEGGRFSEDADLLPELTRQLVVRPWI